MKVPNVTPTKINITKELNKGRTYLYNEVVNMIAEHPVPALVSNEGIRIEAAKGSRNVKALVEKLNNAGIKFNILA